METPLWCHLKYFCTPQSGRLSFGNCFTEFGISLVQTSSSPRPHAAGRTGVHDVQHPSYPAYSHAPSHGARCAVRGVRYAVRGVRCAVRGARCAVRGERCAARGARYANVALLGHRTTHLIFTVAEKGNFRVPRTAYRPPHTAHRVPRTAHRFERAWQ